MSCLLLCTAPVGAQTADELFAVGVASHERGDLADAERVYRATIAADAAHVGAHLNLAGLYLHQGRLAEAETWFRAAIRLTPNSGPALEGLSTALLMRGRTKEAIAERQRLVAVSEGEYARRLLAHAFLADGRISDGCRELQRALNFNSLNSALQLELAACHAENDDLQAAAMHANAVLRRDPQNTVAQEFLGAVAARQRAETWIMLPVVILILAALAAVAAKHPEQWGQRRVAFGVMAIAVAAIVTLAVGPLFWMAGGLWGILQFYAALRFRRSRAERLRGRNEYLRAAAGVLGCVALADGELQSSELRLIRQSYEEAGFDDRDLEIIGQTLQRCLARFQATLFAHEAIYASLRDACLAFAPISNDVTRLELFRTAVRVALADQHVSSGELSVVKACGAWLNISDEEQAAVWREGGLPPSGAIGTPNASSRSRLTGSPETR